MNSIQTSSSSSLYQLLRTQQSGASSARAGQPPQLEQQLESALSSSGLSDDQQASLQSDLQSTLEGLFGSGSTMPDPDSVKSAVSDVFEKYGLDAESMASKLGPPPGSGFGTRGGFQTDAYDDSSTTLMDLLQELSSQASDDKTSSSKQSQYLMAALIGFDKSA